MIPGRLGQRVFADPTEGLQGAEPQGRRAGAGQARHVAPSFARYCPHHTNITYIHN